MLGVPEWKRTDRGERTTLCVWQKSQAYCSESNRKSESSPHPWPCACLWSSWTQPNGLIRHLTGRQTRVPSSNLTFRNQDLWNTCACSEEIIIWNRFGTCRVGGQLVWDARCSETGLVVWMTFISAGSASFFVPTGSCHTPFGLSVEYLHSLPVLNGKFWCFSTREPILGHSGSGFGDFI